MVRNFSQCRVVEKHEATACQGVPDCDQFLRLTAEDLCASESMSATDIVGGLWRP
jgi:hypothetical protein